MESDYRYPWTAAASRVVSPGVAKPTWLFSSSFWRTPCFFLGKTMAYFTTLEYMGVIDIPLTSYMKVYNTYIVIVHIFCWGGYRRPCEVKEEKEERLGSDALEGKKESESQSTYIFTPVSRRQRSDISTYSKQISLLLCLHSTITIFIL